MPFNWNLFPHTSISTINLDFIFNILNNLKGGIAGQFLKKKTADNYDFEWTSEVVTKVNGKTGTVTLNAADVGAGTYTKPDTGIPETDLSQSVQDSLSAANEAIANVLKAFPVGTATGAMAAFTDGADDVPVKNLAVAIEPVQSGSGDPAPDNVRPITGWTGVTVSHSGADTSNPETLTISWQTEAGTVYGGSLDVTTGVLTVDREMISITDMNVIASASKNYSLYTVGELGYINTNLSAMSNVLTTYVGAAADLTEGSFMVINSAARNAALIYLCFPECSGATQAECRNNNREYLETLVNNGIIPQFVFGIAEPLTYQLTPHEVNTLLGENNIWADTGDTTVEYRADPTLYINARI